MPCCVLCGAYCILYCIVSVVRIVRIVISLALSCRCCICFVLLYGEVFTVCILLYLVILL